jgi:hypothetical protein
LRHATSFSVGVSRPDEWNWISGTGAEDQEMRST